MQKSHVCVIPVKLGPREGGNGNDAASLIQVGKG